MEDKIFCTCFTSKANPLLMWKLDVKQAIIGLGGGLPSVQSRTQAGCWIGGKLANALNYPVTYLTPPCYGGAGEGEWKGKGPAWYGAEERGVYTHMFTHMLTKYMASHITHRSWVKVCIRSHCQSRRDSKANK